MFNARWKRELALIFLVSIPFLFAGLASTSFLDPDEGMYGAIAREMAEGRDWITPHFNGVRYLFKPPLYFWLAAFTMSVVGPSEWAVRFWCALPALGAAVLTWHLGKMLYGSYAGLFSAVIMLSSVGIFRYVRVAAPDLLFVFSITLALYGFVKSALSQSKVSHRWSLVFYLGTALAVLSKGLIGLVFPVIIIAFLVLLTRVKGPVLGFLGQQEWRSAIDPFVRAIYSPLGLLLFLALVLPWHVLAAWKNPGFFEFYVVDNQFLRFFNLRAFHEGDIPVSAVSFLVLTFLWFFPWSCCLPASLRYGFPSLKVESGARERLQMLVGLWALTVLGFFSLSPARLEHYFLPAVPPLSLMVGALWSEVFLVGDPFHPQSRGLKRCLWALVLGGSLFGAGLLLWGDLLTPPALLTALGEFNVYYRVLLAQGATFLFDSVAPFVGLFKAWGIALIIALPLSLLFLQRQLVNFSFSVLVLLAGVLCVLLVKLDLLVEPYHSSRAVGQALLAQAGSSTFIVHEGPLEYSGGLPFYTGRRIYLLDGKEGDLVFGSRFRDAADLFLDKNQFVRMWDAKQMVFLVTQLPVEKGALENIPRDRIFLVGRYGSRWLYANRRVKGSS